MTSPQGDISFKLLSLQTHFLFQKFHIILSELQWHPCFPEVKCQEGWGYQILINNYLNSVHHNSPACSQVKELKYCECVSIQMFCYLWETTPYHKPYNASCPKYLQYFPLTRQRFNYPHKAAITKKPLHIWNISWTFSLTPPVFSQIAVFVRAIPGLCYP